MKDKLETDDIVIKLGIVSDNVDKVLCNFSDLIGIPKYPNEALNKNSTFDSIYGEIVSVKQDCNCGYSTRDKLKIKWITTVNDYNIRGYKFDYLFIDINTNEDTISSMCCPTLTHIHDRWRKYSWWKNRGIKRELKRLMKPLDKIVKRHKRDLFYKEITYF